MDSVEQEREGGGSTERGGKRAQAGRGEGNEENGQARAEAQRKSA